MKLLKLYEAILKFASYAVTPDGYVKVNIGDNKDTAIVDGRSLVLPVREQLSYFDKSSKILFHPFAEDMMQDESKVCAAYRQNLPALLNLSIVSMIVQLAQFLASPAEHKGLTPEQLQILEAVPNLDANSLKSIAKAVTEAAENDPQSPFFNMYVCRGGKLNGKTHGYVAVVTFTFYRDLIAGKYENVIKGKHALALRQLCEFMFPMLDQKDHYSFASEAEMARCFDSVLRAFLGLVTRYKYLRDLYKDVLTGPGYEEGLSVDFDLDWLPDYEGKSSLYGEIRSIQSPTDRSPVPVAAERSREPVAEVRPTETEAGIDYREKMRQLRQGGHRDDRRDDRREDPRDFRDDRGYRRQSRWADDDDYRRGDRDGRRGRGMSFRESVIRGERERFDSRIEEEDVETPDGWMPLYEARRRFPQYYDRIRPEDIDPLSWRRDPFAGRRGRY